MNIYTHLNILHEPVIYELVFDSGLLYILGFLALYLLWRHAARPSVDRSTLFRKARICTTEYQFQKTAGIASLLKAKLGYLEAPLGLIFRAPSWVHWGMIIFCPCWAVLKPSWVSCGHLGANLGPSQSQIGAYRCQLGTVLGPTGANLGRSAGKKWEANQSTQGTSILGVILEPSCAIPQPNWSHPEAIPDHVGST